MGKLRRETFLWVFCVLCSFFWKVWISGRSHELKIKRCRQRYQGVRPPGVTRAGARRLARSHNRSSSERFIRTLGLFYRLRIESTTEVERDKSFRRGPLSKIGAVRVGGDYGGRVSSKVGRRLDGYLSLGVAKHCTLG